MGFSYYGANGTQDLIDIPRILISDTQPVNHLFEDSEILAMYKVQNATFQSSMFYGSAPTGGAMGSGLPSTPVSYLRIAALLLDALAAISRASHRSSCCWMSNWNLQTQPSN